MPPTDSPRVAASPLLQLAGIRKVFFTDELETHALFDLDLAVHRHEYVAIEGPSGSGKTTLLSILGLLDTPSAGTYRFDGREVSTLGARERARVRNSQIGFIFQTFNLIGDLTVSQNIELPLLYRNMPAKERKQRVDSALARVQMDHRRNHMPGQLSGGQQQRIAVARAVAGDPAILFADEPTGSLDSKNGDGVMDLLDELHRAGATICMVTHAREYAKRAKRAVHLFDGRIVDDVARAA
jgi:putative ABC transport system ATP-binding protein